MSPPTRHLTRMVLFVIAVVVVAAVLFRPLTAAFMANPALNSLILATFLIGIGFCFRSVLTLRPEIRWLDFYQLQREGRVAPGALPKPRLLAPMSRMLGERRGRLAMSALAMRSMLDGISARLDESREISRYFVGLLIFLGLLGTFWGLLQTISSVGGVINDLSVDQGDLNIMFESLKEGLAEPLTGMGTAFSASLFGLSGSLVLGFLELQASQAQNRFYNELEDWLSGAAQVTTGGGTIEGDLPVPAYLQALVEQTAENLDMLQRSTTAGEEERRQTAAAMMALAEKLSTLNDHMRTQHAVLVRVAETQTELRPLIARLAEAASTDRFGIDEQTRHHIRNIETYADRLVQELATGRAQTVAEIRAEIKLLARTIAALAEEAEQ